MEDADHSYASFSKVRYGHPENGPTFSTDEIFYGPNIVTITMKDGNIYRGHAYGVGIESFDMLVADVEGGENYHFPLKLSDDGEVAFLPDVEDLTLSRSPKLERIDKAVDAVLSRR